MRGVDPARVAARGGCLATGPAEPHGGANRAEHPPLPPWPARRTSQWDGTGPCGPSCAGQPTTRSPGASTGSWVKGNQPSLLKRSKDSPLHSRSRSPTPPPASRGHGRVETRTLKGAHRDRIRRWPRFPRCRPSHPGHPPHTTEHHPQTRQQRTPGAPRPATPIRTLPADQGHPRRTPPRGSDRIGSSRTGCTGVRDVTPGVKTPPARPAPAPAHTSSPSCATSPSTSCASPATPTSPAPYATTPHTPTKQPSYSPQHSRLRNDPARTPTQHHPHHPKPHPLNESQPTPNRALPKT